MTLKDKLSNFFGKEKETIENTVWDWSTFKTTENFPISKDLLDWVIGQDHVIAETRLCIDEWIAKLLWLKKKEWWKIFEDPTKDKPKSREMLPAGPFLLLMGDPGTGKSLLGRAMSNYMTDLYEEKQISLCDVVAWKNQVLPSQPRISIHLRGKGKEIIQGASRTVKKKSWWGRFGLKIFLSFLVSCGIFLIGLAFYSAWQVMIAYETNYALALGTQSPLLIGGAGMAGMGFMVWFFSKMLGGIGSNQEGIGGAKSSHGPKLLVDNSAGFAPFIDATGHGSAQLFGSIAWDPYQCLSEDTRVYTQEGFKYHQDLKVGDLVLSLNPNTKCLEWTSITDIFRQNVQENLLEIEGQRFSMKGTKDHKQLVEEGSWVYLKNMKGKHFPTNYEWNSGKECPELIAKLIGWYLTEGHRRKDRRYIRITQIKAGTRQEILDLLSMNGIRHYVQKKDITITEPWIYDLCLECGHGSYNKFIPRKYLDAGPKTIQILWETMMKGDGNGRVYFTQSKSLMEGFAELSIKLGLSVTISDKFEKYVSTGHSKKLVKKRHIIEVPYSGIIFSPHLAKNHFYLVERKGRLNFTGNTGGLGTPEHQRMTVGDVHRAHLGILFIDEMKNLTGQEAITLLTVLEDGQLPVALRSQFHGGDTAAMAVSSEPIPAMFFLIAAGNLDSMKQIHPALLDRIQGYGKVVYMSNDMPDNVANRRKYVQFISQESKRFNLLPASKEACICMIEEARRKSGRNDRLTCKFRPMISVIKTASILALNEKEKVVSPRHVEEALNVHCKSLGFQVMEKQISNMAAYKIVNPHSKPMIGQIHGLAVHILNEETGDKVGAVLTVKGSAHKKHGQAYFTITGTKKSEDSYIQDSIVKVRHVILQRLGKNVSTDFCTHVDFAQEHEVDGPSAGITMTLCLLSALTKQKIRQDVAITGEINIGCAGQTLVTPIGGAHEKIMAAQAWGFKKVVIPLKNFEHSIDPSDYKIKVVGAATLDDYIREVMISKRKKNGKGKDGIRR